MTVYVVAQLTLTDRTAYDTIKRSSWACSTNSKAAFSPPTSSRWWSKDFGSATRWYCDGNSWPENKCLRLKAKGK
jgi:hypothetical protein